MFLNISFWRKNILQHYFAFVPCLRWKLSYFRRTKRAAELGCGMFSYFKTCPWATHPPLSSMEYGKQLTTKIDANLDSKLCQSIFTESFPSHLNINFNKMIIRYRLFQKMRMITSAPSATFLGKDENRLRVKTMSLGWKRWRARAKIYLFKMRCIFAKFWIWEEIWNHQLKEVRSNVAENL